MKILYFYITNLQMQSYKQIMTDMLKQSFSFVLR